MSAYEEARRPNRPALAPVVEALVSGMSISSPVLVADIVALPDERTNTIRRRVLVLKSTIRVD